MATHRVLYVRWLSLFDEETALLSHSPYNVPLKDFFFLPVEKSVGFIT
jgi:hypothetical protein